ncbi:Isoleucyl-tRNA synthetase [Gaiella occulta]|uniref:isoleucine--tRNA ligase n=1 Tax=Gaiella occulta TaxID=1002870 RepID=A0A7M2YWT4_9ACTN|nr:class I tRNA ligase family protein [Gaiella occulta]RDI74526.1 Isoleucyl-tRNA synthetase [Gaiella occulta]
MFAPLPDKPDHDGLERAILDVWEREQTFARLRAKNADGPRFSFIDGPVTANKGLAVHTAWGRTLKDVFQRYKALRGCHQRYQNGFDCQGLWIEVGVERALGLNSKREIEEYGLAEFARKCRDVVVWSAQELTRGSIRLGQWMDWGNDYFTFSDTNIEYIWRFLRIVHDRGWLVMGHRSTEWCPRCGTSISAHELHGSYVDRVDPSLDVRFRLLERPGEAIVIWTTTPWTLPANVAAAVDPDAEYGRLESGDWVAVARSPHETFVERLPGSALVGWRYEGPFDALGPGAGVEHRVIPWTDVSMDDGTGIVHIAPGCGSEDFELSRALGLDVLTPVDEAGRFYPEYGWLHGLSTVEAADQIIGDLEERGLLVEARTHEHRYPECWRCHTPLIFRLADDWFITVDEIRQQLLDANATVEWTPAYMGKRMDDWLRNMGDWNISRRRYYGLPLPIYPCSCGHVNVIGSRAELEARALSGLEQLEELRRPWIDEVPIACERCGEEVRRIPEVGDVWLDAGIVPFSTLGWQNDTYVPGGYATGAARGLTNADLPDHATWEQWFPADWVSEMREQIRLWFYSQLFMSVALSGQAPFRRVLGYEKMLDEHGKEMHGSWGNMIDASDAFTRMGADVMRWQYCAQPPDRNLLFGFGPGQEIKRKLLTLWNSARFLVDYGNVESFTPLLRDLERGPEGDVQPLDRWLVARTQTLVQEATGGYERWLTVDVVRAFEAFVDDVSNWYIRRSRRRFWEGDAIALRTLWYALVQGLRVISPVMPFLSEHLWRTLVSGACADAPASIFLAGWPEPVDPDAALLAEVAELRRVVALGHQARQSSGRKVRQPLRRIVVEGAPLAAAHADEIRDELRVKAVEFGAVDATELRVKPHLPALGPRLGRELGAVRAALQAGDFEELGGGRFRAAGHELGPDEVLVERSGKEGWAVAAEDGVTVALEIVLDEELEREGRVYDLIHQVNSMRKDAGLELTDRIELTLPATDADLLEHAEWIRAETLAVAVEADGGTVAIAKA